MNPETAEVHLISDTGAVLWPLLDGSATVSELADDVAAVFGLEPAAAEDQVATFVSQLVVAGMVVESTDEE